MSRSISPVVLNAAAAALRYLAAHPDGATKDALCTNPFPDGAAVSKPTMQRALVWLRDEKDAPIRFDRADGKWKLTAPDFTLPLLDPSQSDFEAVLFASALLEPLVDASLLKRLERLEEDMDLKVRERTSSRKGKPPIQLRRGALTATVTTGKPANLDLVTKIVHAIGKRPLKIRYKSPWADPDDAGREHEIEPWQLRIHDGALYLRAYSVTRQAPRSFRVAQIEHLLQLPPRAPRAQIPPKPEIWGAADPAYGVDSDRPGVAIVRLRGAVARWAVMEQWHDEQEDTWIEDGQLLERRVAYRSCRELARRLASLGDGLVHVEPEELRAEVRQLATAILDRL